MNDRKSDYFRTIVFMCDDILREIDDITELAGENRHMEELLATLRERDSYDIGHVQSLEAALGRYQAKLTALFARYPDVPYVDTLLRRMMSLRGMCADCADQFR